DVGADVEAEPQVGPLRRRRPPRVDDDELRALVHGLQHVMEEDRVRLAGVRAPEDDQVRGSGLLVGARPAACTEHRRQTDDAGRVSGSVAAVDVVRPEHDPRELLRGEVQLVGRLGAAEDARERAFVERRAEPGRGAFERLVPARRAQLSTVSDERRRQPCVLHRHARSLARPPCPGQPRPIQYQAGTAPGASQPVVRRRRTSSSLTAHSCVRAYSACAFRSGRPGTSGSSSVGSSIAGASTSGASEPYRWMRCARVSASSSTGHAIRSRPVAPGSGLARRDMRPTPRWSSASSAMRLYVVSFPPATLTIPDGPVENTVSRRAFAVPPSPPGSTRSPQYVARTGPMPSTATDASARICSTSSSVTATASGSPSCNVSVVPSRSIPSHGTAKLTRTLSCGIVSAAPQSCPPSTSTCAPLLSRIDGFACSSSSRRIRSTHGPAAFTTLLACTAIVRPSACTSSGFTPTTSA